MSFLQKVIIRYFLVWIALILPLQPCMLIAKEKDLSKEALLAQFMKHMQGPSFHALGKVAMGKIPEFDEKKSIIGATERRELQIDALAKKLDKTLTTFGSVALPQSLQPGADLTAIGQRQSWAKAMLDDEQLYTDIQRSLKRIKKSEHAMLAYWDATQRENGSKLFARAEGFYYALLQIILGEKINDSKWWLEAAMVQKMAGIVWDVVFYFGGQKLWWDSMEAQFGDKKLKPYESIRKGLMSPLLFALPWQSQLSDKIRQGYLDQFAVCDLCNRPDCNSLEMCLGHGIKERVSVLEVLAPGGIATMGDTALYASRGIRSRSEVELGKLGQAAWWLGDKYGQAKNKLGQVTTQFVTTPLSDAGKFVTDNYVPDVVKQSADTVTSTVRNNTPGFIKNNIGMPHVPEFIKESFGYFKPNGDWISEPSVKDPNQLAGLAWFRNWAFGWGVALVATGIKAQLYIHGIKTTYNATRNAIRTMKELHLHTMHIARTIATVKEITQRLEKHPAFGSSYIVARVNKVITHASAELKQLFELLEKDTFAVTKENARTQIFSRGNVFLAHRLMTKVQEELVPLLHSIGELDALYAMVTNMKESTPQMPFSFAEFIASSQASIDIQGGWLPLVRNAVPNTMTLGGTTANKVVITGPNGCGKSVDLKLKGAIAVMAHSWGIVPAEKVRMTVLNGLRSCIHPEESLEHELSTFMAEKMRIDAIKDFVFTHHHDPHFKTMLLLDEPFRGTVDAESADRIYEFGKEIAALPQTIVLIATHVEKPIRLAQDTNGAFANYHVCIEELPDGRFNRKFTLEPGILEWWFTDAKKRSRFIDFVTMEKHKEQLAKMMATQQVAATA